MILREREEKAIAMKVIFLGASLFKTIERAHYGCRYHMTYIPLQGNESY